MLKLVYNIAVFCALPCFAVIALLNRKIRANFTERLFPDTSNRQITGGIWIHAASVGEAVIAENLIRYLSRSSREQFVVTTNTHYTRDLLRKKFGSSVEVYSAPLDLPFSLNRFIDKCRFDALVIIETEIWPNTIWKAKARNIPVIVVNGRISDATVGRYRRLSFFLRRLFESVDMVLAQSEEHAKRFLLLGVAPEKVMVTGNLKYYREMAGLPQSPVREKALVFGSVREKELPIVLPVIGRLTENYRDLKFYVAPRELHLVDRIEEEMSRTVTTCRYSHHKQAKVTDCRIVVVDTVGDLMGIYSRCLAAFVGGSLAPYGGQNMLEPIFMKTPVVFGPSVENFEAVARAIIEHQAGIMVHDANELFSVLMRLVDDDFERQRLIDAGEIVINLQKGAMEKTAKLVMESIWKNSRNSSG